MNKKLRSRLAALLGGIAMVTAGAVHAADVPESDDPIIIGINEWTGQHISAYIAGHILEKMGYNVEYTTAAVFPMATALADGNITLGLELWDNNMGEWFPRLLDEGKVEDLGAVGLDAREGWLYPKHVEELCPGLPDWEAFLGCTEVFSTAETFPDGRFLEYPADWGDRSTQLIAAEGLPFQAIPRRQRRRARGGVQGRGGQGVGAGHDVLGAPTGCSSSTSPAGWTCPRTSSTRAACRSRGSSRPAGRG